jgi:serine protease Do
MSDRLHVTRNTVRRWAAGWLLSAGALCGTVLAAQPPGDDEAMLTEQGELLARAAAAVVGVQVQALGHATSADTLGKLRLGSGVVIGADGLVLTIGYLILEADQVDLQLDSARIVPARVVAYDQATGFGLLQPLTPLRLPPAPLGDTSQLASDEPVVIVSGRTPIGQGELSIARVVSRRSFSGYWEYHIDGALFTSPPRADHSGAALFNANGELLGIGSLIVADAAGEAAPRLPGNMFVPVDLLKPILKEMRESGSTAVSHRPWLGVNCVESDGQVRVVKVNRGSPAEAAGLQAGDLILRIDGVAVGGLERFYKTLWRGSTPEREVTLEVQRGDEKQTLKAHATDRMKTLTQSLGV